MFWLFDIFVNKNRLPEPEFQNLTNACKFPTAPLLNVFKLSEIFDLQ